MLTGGGKVRHHWHADADADGAVIEEEGVDGMVLTVIGVGWWLMSRCIRG